METAAIRAKAVLAAGFVCLGGNGCNEELTAHVTGRVFFDHDRDKTFSSGDELVTDGYVLWETSYVAEIDSHGTYGLAAPEQPGIVWVRGVGNMDPGPFWAATQGLASEVIDLPVQPISGSGAFTFVVASDTHAGIRHIDPADQAWGLLQATDVFPKPYFIAVTGDITTSNMPDQFAAVKAGIDAIDAINVPYVPIPGNHDWYDGGASYRGFFGPPSYSFDAGGVHFLVLNDADSVDTRLRFVGTDLGLVSGDPILVAMMHAPPRDELLDGLVSRGIDYLLTGHLHANRVLVHDDMIHYITQPLVMGGIDQSPAGYRVFSLGPDRTLSVRGRTTVNEPIARVVAPGYKQVAPEHCALPLIAAVEMGSDVAKVTAQVQGSPAVELRHAGGWSYVSDAREIGLCQPGTYALSLAVELAGGGSETLTEELTIDVAAPMPPIGEWPMLQGGASHAGASATTTIGTPLVTHWVATVGGHVHGGSPVVADGRVFVAVTDLGDGKRGGVVALDAGTGRVLWEHRIGFAVRNAPAVADGVVVFLANNGTVHAVEAATGAPRWTYELAPHVPAVTRSVYSAPAIVGGVVYAGVRRELVALDLSSGMALWSVEPSNEWGDMAAQVSPAVDCCTLLMSFDQGYDGLYAFDAATGGELWRAQGTIAQHMHASPVIVGDTAYVINQMTHVTAVNLLDGSTRWQRAVEPDALDWGFLVSATPAYASGVLYVTTLRGTVAALDAATGDVLWRREEEPSLFRITHYHGEVAAVFASPVVTGELVWIATPSGHMRALNAATGNEIWSYELGVPITATPVVAGEVMFVASYDGTVRAMSAARES